MIISYSGNCGDTVAKNPQKVIIGRESKANGAMFEKYIDAACEVYKREGVAAIDKTPEPFKVTKRTQDGKFVGVFVKKAQPDYKGTLKNGRSIIFDAKYTAKDRINQSALTDEQAEALQQHSSLGAFAFILVTAAMSRFSMVPFDIWKNMKKIYGRKYMLIEELEPYEVFYTGYIDFLGNLKEANNAE